MIYRRRGTTATMAIIDELELKRYTPLSTCNVVSFLELSSYIRSIWIGGVSEQEKGGNMDIPIWLPLTGASRTGENVNVPVILPAFRWTIDLGQERDRIPTLPALDVLRSDIMRGRRRRGGQGGKGRVATEDARRMGPGVFRGRGDGTVGDGKEGGGGQERRGGGRRRWWIRHDDLT